MLANPRADRIRAAGALGGRAAVRKRRGAYLVEGPQAVRELVAHRAAMVSELFVQHPAPSPAIGAIATQATRSGVTVRPASGEVLGAISPNTQGIAAIAQLPLTAPLEELAAPKPTDMVVYLPEISDPGNLGTLIRIADAAGASAVIVGPTCVEVTNPKVIRASAGSVFHLPLLSASGDDDVPALLKAAGYRVVGAHGYATTQLPNSRAATADRVAWMFGNEAHGLNAAAQQVADELVAIPLYGKAESLNVAAAAAIALYHSAMCQQRG